MSAAETHSLAVDRVEHAGETTGQTTSKMSRPSQLSPFGTQKLVCCQGSQPSAQAEDIETGSGLTEAPPAVGYTFHCTE
jgi:hypothetical protein